LLYNVFEITDERRSLLRLEKIVAENGVTTIALDLRLPTQKTQSMSFPYRTVSSEQHAL
jgi:hypothetical protein